MSQKLNKSYTIVTLHFTTLLFLIPYSSEEEQELKESEILQTFSPGAYFEEQDASLYDTVFPIIFKFKNPEWSEQLTLKLSSDCSNDTWGEGNGTQSLCPVFFHLQQELSKELELESAFPRSFRPETNETVTFECDILSKHFISDKLTNEKLKLYLEHLKKCSTDKCMESELITEYSSKIQPVYDTMVKKLEEYYSKLPTEDRVNKASELNDKLALSGLLTSHYFSLVKRWRRGYRDCKAGFVPDALISSC